MGKIEGVRIKNFGPLKDLVMGKTLSNQKGMALGNLTAIIGPSGNGKSTLADAFGFLADCLEIGVEAACDTKNRGGFQQIRSQGVEEPIKFELYYWETSITRPITYELEIDEDGMGRPYVKEERLRQRVEKRGWPLSFLFLQSGKGYAYEGKEGGADDNGRSVKGEKVDVELADIRKLGIVTLGAMKQYERIEKFLNFLKSWYLCYFSPDAARSLQTAAPQSYLNRTGSNINNVAQYMYRENKKEFTKVLKEIQTKLPNIDKIEPVKFDNGQMMLKFWEHGFEKAFSKQLFVTTHSPFFVNALSPDHVWVLTKGENGFSSIKRASEYDFVKELSEEGVPLGDMWYSRYFG